MNWPYETGASLATLQDAYELIVRQFQHPLAQYLYRFVFRQDLAIDLTQETFVKAFLNLHRYDNTRPFSTWLFSIASNLAKDQLRKNSSRVEVPYCEASGFGEEEDFRRPDRRAEAGELGDALEAAISDLPLAYREPLVLRHTAGMSIEEIAAVLQTNVAVVKTRLFRARGMLQEALGKEWLPR